MSSRHAQFFPSSAGRGRNHFRGTPARSALTWVIASQNSCTLSFERPATSTLGTPASSRRTTLGLRECTAGLPFLADVEVVSALVVAGVPQLTARLLTGIRAHHAARQYGLSLAPGGAPVCRSSTWTGSLGAIPL